jgi:hypothetical protein
MAKLFRRRTAAAPALFSDSEEIRKEATALFEKHHLSEARSLADLLKRLGEIRGLPLFVRAVNDPAVKKKTAIGINDTKKIEFLLFRSQLRIESYWDIGHEVGHAVGGHPCTAKEILLDPALRKYVPKGATAWGRPPGIEAELATATEVDDTLWNEGVAEQIGFAVIRSLLIPTFVPSERRYG